MSTDEFSLSMVPFRDEGFFWVTFHGRCGLTQLQKAHEMYMNHPFYRPGQDELLDFSNTSIERLTTRGIEMIRHYLLARPESQVGRSVMVVGTEREYGLARMMDGWLEPDVPVDRWVCYTVEEGLEWLRPGRGEHLLARHAALQAAEGSVVYVPDDD